MVDVKRRLIERMAKGCDDWFMRSTRLKSSRNSLNLSEWADKGALTSNIYHHLTFKLCSSPADHGVDDLKGYRGPKVKLL
jgi:hypothetical protein